MSDNAADILTGSATLSASVEIGDDTIDIGFVDPTFDDLEAVEENIDGRADDITLAREYIDEFLTDPDVDAGEISVGKALAVYQAMQEEIVNSSGVTDAIDDMPMDGEGNE